MDLKGFALKYVAQLNQEFRNIKLQRYRIVAIQRLIIQWADCGFISREDARRELREIQKELKDL